MRDDLRNEHHTKMRATMTRAKMRATMRNDHQMTKRNRKNAPLLYFTKNIQNARQFSTIVFVQPTEKNPHTSSVNRAKTVENDPENAASAKSTCRRPPREAHRRRRAQKCSINVYQIELIVYQIA